MKILEIEVDSILLNFTWVKPPTNYGHKINTASLSNTLGYLQAGQNTKKLNFILRLWCEQYVKYQKKIL